MVEISLSGSGEGPGEATTRGYSTSRPPGWRFGGRDAELEMRACAQPNQTVVRKVEASSWP